MNQEEVDNLIARFLSGEALPEEAEALFAWLDKSHQNRLYFEEVSKAGGYALPKLDTQQAYAKVKEQVIARKKNQWPKWISVAASLILICGFWFVFRKQVWVEPTPTAWEAKTDTLQFHLAYNSSVALFPKSALKRSKLPGRTYELEGSAFFRVEHNATEPMVVAVKEYLVKDIGTAFYILSHDSGIFVKVIEGEVEVNSPFTASISLKAGEEKSLYKEEEIEEDNRPIVQQEPVKTTLDFHNTPLSEVAKKLSAHFKLDIVFETAPKSDCLLTAKFTGEEAESVVTVIAVTFNLDYEKTNKGFILKGVACP